MKSFYRNKIINGIQYVYEITPYYDPVTKKVRQKSRYLGKDQDGKITKVREKKLRDVFSYGEFLPVEQIIRHYQLDKFLTKELGKVQMQVVFAICFARLFRGLSLQHVGTWYEGTWLYYRNRELPLSSSSISRLLSSIGEKRLQDKLITHLIRQLKSKRTILYDITSVSSYSELIRLLEWGYNKDQHDLEFSTPHAHKDETLKGLMFVSLLALIIRMNIMNVLKQADKLKDYNFEKMMLQLEKIKAVVNEDGKVFYPEITKKQRELLELFHAVPKE